jgi:hypothetical protein
MYQHHAMYILHLQGSHVGCFLAVLLVLIHVLVALELELELHHQ